MQPRGLRPLLNPPIIDPDRRGKLVARQRHLRAPMMLACNIAKRVGPGLLYFPVVAVGADRW